MKKRYNVKNVEDKVLKAISNYCREQGITQARYLETDRRISRFIASDEKNPWHKNNGYVSE